MRPIGVWGDAGRNRADAPASPGSSTIAFPRPVVRGGAGDVVRRRHRQQAVDVGSGQPGVVQGAANRLELERERGPFGKFALLFVT
jgi:hypothetical protein